MERKKSKQFLSALLILTIAFIMVVVDCELVNAAVSGNGLINGTFGEYYTYSYDQATQTLTLDMKTEKNEHIKHWYDLSFDVRTAKKLIITKNVLRQSESQYNFEHWLTDIGNFESITVEQGNKDYSAEDGILYNREKSILYAYPEYRPGDVYTIPESVVQIGNDEVAYGKYTCPFDVVQYLKEVKIHENVSAIYKKSFSSQIRGNINSIEKFVVSEKNPNYKSDNGVLFTKDGSKLILYPASKKLKKYIVPKGVVVIGEDSFSCADNLKEVILPKTIEVIDKGAFYDTYNHAWEELRKIAIPMSVEYIGNGALDFPGVVSFEKGTKFKVLPIEAFGRGSTPVTVNYPCDLTWTLTPQEEQYKYIK